MAKKHESNFGALVPTSAQAKRENLLDSDIKALSAADRQALSKQILTEQIALDRTAKESDQQFADSTRDMARDVQAVRGLEDATRGDYNFNATYKTASGETSFSVRKNNNTAAMVIAVVVGLVLLFFLNR